LLACKVVQETVHSRKRSQELAADGASHGISASIWKTAKALFTATLNFSGSAYYLITFFEQLHGGHI
jgi:hypothetical protein